jgi:hypothetical protein
MYMKQRRYQEAESDALAAYRGLANRLGEEHELTQRVVERLVALYAATGRPSEAAQWRAKLRKE